MKTFNKISAIIWFAIAAIGIVIALAKWSLTYFLFAMVFSFIGKVAWQEYREIKNKEDTYQKFKKSNN